MAKWYFDDFCELSILLYWFISSIFCGSNEHLWWWYICSIFCGYNENLLWWNMYSIFYLILLLCTDCHGTYVMEYMFLLWCVSSFMNIFLSRYICSIFYTQIVMENLLWTFFCQKIYIPSFMHIVSWNIFYVQNKSMCRHYADLMHVYVFKIGHYEDLMQVYMFKSGYYAYLMQVYVFKTRPKHFMLQHKHHDINKNTIT